jgi:hypothetical protein
MQKAVLYLEDGNKKEVYLLDEKDVDSSKEFQKKNWKEHIYIGYLIIGSVAFALGIWISLKRINGGAS